MSGPRNTPSRASSYSSLVSSGATDNQHNAALLGATKAFGRPPPKPRAPSNTYVGVNNGAATAAGRITGHGNIDDARRLPEGAGGSTQPASNKATTGSTQQRPDLNATKKPNLAPPAPDARARSKSPSQQAAQLATARAPATTSMAATETTPRPIRPRAKTSQRPDIAPKPRRLSDRFNSPPSTPTDNRPIPPTNSLVELFERKSSTPTSPGIAKGIRPSQDLPMRSPKPLHKSDGSGLSTVFQMELGENTDALRTKASNKATARDQDTSTQYDGHGSSDDYVSASEDTASAPTSASKPLTIRKRDSRGPSITSEDASSPEGKPLRPPPSQVLGTQPMRIQQVSPERVSPSSQSITAQYHMLNPRRVTPLHTGDDLANAIVASSLASSRAGSPHKSSLAPPPPPSRRKDKHGVHGLSFSRTPSPAKTGMRHTLRKEDSDSDESDDETDHPYGKHKKKRLVRKHPNKHHEGDRKRWRDAVTERERKRYEGVYASNKGLHCTLTPEEEAELARQPESEEARARKSAVSDQVSNIVARDIWSRSRLAESLLESVWDLVDNDEVGRLSKEEFVVGLWLIDQLLKGRKLPVKVSESVWASVRGLQGIKIRKMH